MIVVSNRGPIAYERDKRGHVVATRSSGGLATALRGLAHEYDVTWIASAMTEADREVAEASGRRPLRETIAGGATVSLCLIAHDADAYERYYNTIANPLLWFIHHQLFPLGIAPSHGRELAEAWEEGYLAVNQRFADAVAAELDSTPDALVVFHDYHLYLAPALVRRRVPEAALAQVIHIPWPPAESWRVLPESIRRDIHEGVLANDFVALHTQRWKANFLACCGALTAARVDESAGSADLAGHRAHVGARAISVDPAEFERLAASAAVEAEVAALREARPDKLILRVDRTDPSKNIVRGFHAYALLLEEHPELHGRVGMLALLDPSRQTIPEYAAYVAAIRSTADELNERFASGAWQPLDLRIEDNFAQVLAAYRDYDVLFVNAVYDGMNLVVKEAPLVNERNGVIVLSDNTGAFEELSVGVLGINPFDLGAQADALFLALEMDGEERRCRSDAIRQHVREHDLAAWVRWHVGEFREALERQDRRINRVSDADAGLSHVGDDGAVRMVDVGAKPVSRRRAVAVATVRMRAATAGQLRRLPKGDALVAAQLAGIMAAKRTSDLIPLCHPLPLSVVDVALDVGEREVSIRASVETTAQTGVEMEALTAVSVAALCVYDMAKAVDKEMEISGISLLEKSKEEV